MVDFKLVFGTKDGKCFQREVKDEDATYFLGKKVGDTVDGSKFGMAGFECVITGGSDKAGFPMRADVEGTLKKRILAVEGIGLKKKRHGQRQRKTVAGRDIYDGIVQINLKVLKGELKEEKKAESEGAEEKKEEAKEKSAEATEEKKEVPKEEKPAEKEKEEKKEEAKKPKAKAEPKEEKTEEKKE